MVNTKTYIVVHCSADSYRNSFDQFDKINRSHRDERGFPSGSLGIFVGYHTLITGNARTQKWGVIRCRTEDDEGSHCNQGFDGVKVYQPENKPWPPGVISMNFQSLGVCVGFNGDIEMMPSEAYALLQKQVWEWQDKYKVPNERVFFHRKFTGMKKTCPGTFITDQWLRDLLARPLPVVDIPHNACTEEKKTIQDLSKELSWYKALWEEVKPLFSFLTYK